MPIFLQLIYSEIDRLSTLSLEEYVSIVASFHALSEKPINYESLGYTNKQIEAMRKSEKINTSVSLNLQFTKPFRNFPCLDFDFYTMLYRQFDEHGTLPFYGSLTDQPNKIVEIFNTLKALIYESQEKQSKKERNK